MFRIPIDYTYNTMQLIYNVYLVQAIGQERDGEWLVVKPVWTSCTSDRGRFVVGVFWHAPFLNEYIFLKN
jgi:hypothetical protein